MRMTNMAYKTNKSRKGSYMPDKFHAIELVFWGTCPPQEPGSCPPWKLIQARQVPLGKVPQPCAQRAHRNSPTYMHAPSVGMIYPIPTYMFY